MMFADDAPESVYREVRDLDASLREHEHRRRRLLREIAAVQLWQRTRGVLDVADWIAKMTLQQRSGELAAVERRIARIQEKINGIVSRFPQSAALVPDSRSQEVTASAVRSIIQKKPSRRSRF